jgi:cytochrome c-type biogenesis protein CcmE
MKPRQRRFGLVVVGVVLLGVAAALVLTAFRSNLVFFYSPSQVHERQVPAERAFRLGGLVETGTLRREADGLTVRFTVTDTAERVPVLYRGALPDLFREGRGVVTQGRMRRDGVFVANEVLAKHDENYMPPQAAAALDRARSVRVDTVGFESHRP